MKRVSVTVVTALSLLFVSSSAGLAQDAEKSAVKDGWVERAFDFSDPDLDFKVLLPKESRPATVPMKLRQPDTLGNVTIIGEVPAIATAEVPIRMTVIGYDLRTSGAADRICGWVLTQARYKTVEELVSPHRSVASVVGLKYDGDVPVEGVISNCQTRGFQAIAVNLLFDLPKDKSAEDRDAIFDFATDYAQTVFDSITFKNGQNDGYRDGLKDVPIRIDGKSLDISIPDDWEVPINDFDGRANAELHVIKQDEDVAKGGVWLIASDMKDKPDLAEIGSKTIPFFLKAQFSGSDAPKPEGNKAGPDINGKGSLLHHFLFSVKDHKGEDSGDIRAIMIWNEGRLYTLIRWSAFDQDGSSNAFFSTLPMLTIYDAFAAMLEKLLSEKG
ncbi:hypothetical protein J2T09_004369 [Neorhizobium huautlense]|uniref:Uncharacterized protein n=1 Tax=Neorhizobium huautlense TaxID=67774 RepID=A0ABT9PYN3_9HYPH|nr:hypothetical protein [Neorhizobium huautlense]MDP9839593.1 hypothetical protein [Neorhizobium huautlense]